VSTVNEDLIPVQVMLTHDVNEKIESIMEQLGLRSKGAVIERLLAEVFNEVDQQED
jgi:hypothetical protein